MKEEKLAYKEPELEWCIFVREDVDTISWSEQGPMDEDDWGNMGLD